MTKEILIRFLEGRFTPGELEKIIHWIDEEALLDEGKSLAFDDWKSFHEKSFPSGEDVRFNSLLDKIHHTINIKDSVKPKSKQLRLPSPVTAWITRVAAFLLIPVLSFLIYVLSSDSVKSGKYSDRVVDSLEVTAPAGSRTMAQLSDGTKVYLNSGSRIKYPVNFNDAIREVRLSGEGFFEVAHDAEHPFVVRAKQLNIKALGTKFNVLSYPENDVVATTLIEGKVVLEGSAKRGETKTIGTLAPGQHVEYKVSSGIISSTTGNMSKYVGWKDGLLIFDNSGIDEVTERLGRMFNVEIEADDEIKDITYTVKFVDESLSQILDLLTRATPVDYVFLPRKKLSDGTYSKQKIRLKRR